MLAGFPRRFLSLTHVDSSMHQASIKALAGGLILAVTMGQAALAADEVIVDPRDYPIRAGAFARLAEFQDQLHRRLAGCKERKLPVADRDRRGMLGPGTAAEISALAACDKSIVPAGSPAGNEVLTAALWSAVMGSEPPPSAAELAETLTLTFEATDFTDKPEWNFCQDNGGASEGRAERAAASGLCRNESDPCSLLTWGPRGATAGQGRELQWILWGTAEAEPAAIDRAFGPEAANVRRFARLAGPPPDSCDGSSPVERFMCAAWLDPVRRQAWERGLVTLGANAAVRASYSALYRSFPFDGYKLEGYRRLWAALGLAPSEIDFAFFYDRATHIGGPPESEDTLAADLRSCVAAETGARNSHAAARRCLSLRHPHPTQPVDRLGRDVAYYRDAYAPDALSAREVDTWRRHIPLGAAKNFALSDQRDGAIDSGLDPAAPAGEPPQDVVELTAAEAQCPAFILAPDRRPTGRPLSGSLS